VKIIKLIKCILTILGCCFLIINTGYSYSGVPLEYLSSYTLNSRAGGVGNAFTANSGDITNSYWNPAGIARTYFTELSVITIPLYVDTQMLGFSFGYPIDSNQTFGISLVRLVSGAAERTDSIGRNLGYTFRQAQSSYYISYGKQINPIIDIGVNLKSFQNNIDAYFQQGGNADIGIIFHNENDYGICLQNIFPGSLGNDNIYPNLKLGAAGNIKRFNIFIDMYVLNIFSWEPDNDIQRIFRWGTGIEYLLYKGYEQGIVLRTGINHREITFGFGINNKKINFDYSVSMNNIDWVHKFSVNVKYGFLPAEAERMLQEHSESFSREREMFYEESKLIQKDIDEARKQFKLDDWINVQLSVASKHFELNEYEQCRKVLSKILKIAPDNQNARDLLEQLNNRVNIMNVTKKYMEAQAFYLQQDYNNSINLAKEVLSADPEHKNARILTALSEAQILITEKKYQEAKNALLEILKIDSTHSEAIILLKRLEVVLEINR